MTVVATPVVVDSRLVVRGRAVLTGVPGNVTVYPVSAGSAFLGARAMVPSSRHVFTLGVLERGYRFLSLFRSKIWWMIPRVGKSGSEIPMETQMLILEARDDSALHNGDSISSRKDNTFYILMLPVLDGAFRATLQGTAGNELQFCIESGDAHIQTSLSVEAVFVHSGNNPFELIKDSIKILEKQKGTFSHIDNKKLPAHLDWFGWCTWDAFYKEVNLKGIREGLESFAIGGCSPKFLIIDDGWQDTVNDFQKEGEPFIPGTEFAARLVDIKENKNLKSPGSPDNSTDLRELVCTSKEKYGLKYVYMWHALTGYWGGIHPSSEKMKKYDPMLAYPIQSPGNVGNLRDIAMDSLEKYGVGLIDPNKIYNFYDDLHSYLASCGVDGVKVDVQNVLETLGSGYGGRVSLTRKYQEALEQSVARNFNENNLICCMSHNSDSIFSSKKSALMRASEDFMPREPTLQTLHVASVAFNSLLLGEIVVPDWDMFHSKHDTAEFHGAARALGGCAVYVSDKPGNQDFKILRKLVLPDGSILRARHAGRPTRDCLFIDPVMDGKSLFKIWNLNKFSGVIGVFNCQGAGCWPLKQIDENVPCEAISLLGHVRPLDIEFLEEIAGENWDRSSAVYSFFSGSLSVLPNDGKVEVSLPTLGCEIFAVSPVRVLGQDIHIAPIGLLDMYNSGGAVEAVDGRTEGSRSRVKVTARGCGKFGVYCSVRPKVCLVETKEAEFTYNLDNGLVTLELEGDCGLKNIDLVF